MEGRKQSIKDKSILAYTLWGAVGFGIGGAVGGSIWHHEYPLFPFAILGILGAVGGMSLGLALKSWTRAGLLALAGAVGFIVGSFPVGMYIGMALGELQGMHIEPLAIVTGAVFLFISGAFLGMVGGASLGLALKNRQRAGFLIAGGTVGFAIGAQAAWGVVAELPGAVTFVVWGVVGGATLGAALGYLEKRKVMQSN